MNNQKNTKDISTKKKYKSLTGKLKDEIKMQYEVYGSNLIDLAIEYNVNEGTLRNKSSKEKWVKSKYSAIIYAQEVLSETGEAAEKRAEIKKKFNFLGQGLVLRKLLR